MNSRFLTTGMDELQEVNGPVKMSTGTVPVSESSFLDLSLAAICKHLVRCQEVVVSQKGSLWLLPLTCNKIMVSGGTREWQ